MRHKNFLSSNILLYNEDNNTILIFVQEEENKKRESRLPACPPKLLSYSSLKSLDMIVPINDQ
jgi:hypothetical protein